MNGRDRELLDRAVELGRQGWGRVHPNPMVGALLARRGRILAEDWHREFGGPHAEAGLLRRWTRAAAAEAGADDAVTLYCSLEPCSHRGKTPPCTDAILEAVRRGHDGGAPRVGRIVYWAAEPGVREGGGAELLRRAGLQVDGPVGHRDAWAAENPFFFASHDAGRKAPYVALKLAVALDGGIAPAGGRRVWVTGPEARAEAHRLRAGFDAVLVGSRTWEADDPHLTARGEVVPRIPPARVLLDRRGRSTPELRALNGGDGARVLVVTVRARRRSLERRLGGRAEVVAVAEGPGGLDLAEVLDELRERGIATVLCEGGGVLAASLLALGRVDRVYLFVAPRLLGADAVPAFPDPAWGDSGGRDVRLEGWRPTLDAARFGSDTLITLDRR